MLYHYTTILAMRSILQDAGTRGHMCFWATRYDCFADEKEYQLGVLTLFNGMSATQLSDLSHTFPEWKHYQSMIDEKETKRSYPIDVDLFFEPTAENPLFVEEPEVLALTKELYHQYNR